MFKTLKAAAVQASPAFLDLEASLEKAATLVREAASTGASLVVFPETWLPGYPVWANMLVPNRDHPKQKQLFSRLYANAIAVPSPEVGRLGQVAREAGVYLVMGANEKESRFGRGTLYNSILFFGPDGDLRGVHRKLMPTFHERIVWGWGDGSGLLVDDTELGRIGGLICWEHWMPLARYALYTQGEQVHAALWPSRFAHDTLNGEMVQTASRFYAHEGRTFVVAACGYLEKASVPPEAGLDGEMAGEPDVLLAGGSAIIGPYGEYLAGPNYEGEGIIYADLDLQRVVEARQSLDVTGHYSRPDVFRVVVNRRRLDPIEQQDAL